MASDSYSLRALVLRKTKLGETDLIVTLLASDGRQVRAVAKGARKPSSSFASRLEIFSEVDLLLICGKSLDIVKEARLVDAHLGIRESMERAAASAPIVDLLVRLSQPDLEAPRIYDLASSALSHSEKADPNGCLAVCAAFMLKAFAFSGFRPSLNRCVMCGKPFTSGETRVQVSFSAAEGGAVCGNCLMFSDTIKVGSDVLSWAHWLMMSKLDDIVGREVPRSISFEVLRLCQAWVREHVGTKLKSLEFLSNCGLF